MVEAAVEARAALEAVAGDHAGLHGVRRTSIPSAADEVCLCGWYSKHHIHGHLPAVHKYGDRIQQVKESSNTTQPSMHAAATSCRPGVNRCM
jgi:hypothetical protein